MIGNALAYGESGDLPTVMHNLRYIQTLLEKPDQTNLEYDSDDFK